GAGRELAPLDQAGGPAVEETDGRLEVVADGVDDRLFHGVGPSLDVVPEAAPGRGDRSVGHEAPLLEIIDGGRDGLPEPTATHHGVAAERHPEPQFGEKVD